MPFPEVGDIFHSLDNFKRVVYRFAASREIRLGPTGVKDGRTYWRCLLDDKTRTGRAKRRCTYTIATSWADARKKSVKIHRVELSHSCDPAQRKKQAAAAEEAMLDRLDKLETRESESDDDSGVDKADTQPVAGSRFSLRRRTLRADRCDHQSEQRDTLLVPVVHRPPNQSKALFEMDACTRARRRQSRRRASVQASPTGAVSSAKATDLPPVHQADRFEPGDVLTTSQVPAAPPISALKARLAGSAACPSSAPDPCLSSLRAFLRALSPSLSPHELEIYVETMHSLGMQSEEDLALLVRCERSVLAKLASSTKPGEEGRLDPSGGILKLLMAMKSAYEAEH
ncbi:hypothetical protein Rhopal_001356-T1 [Rhodotorula paludigena]|uniref:FLYWCH-type domain-containing protein n=1 Tax=Rhodotorula paludigena TaxID=86838 RepID=A0AAV5GF72_9BASI|nr:hypothetical protein Rhopal_001356-T1 [Rhodotorula paludigena]